MRIAPAAALSLLLASAASAAEAPKFPEPPADKADWKPTGELAELLERMEKSCAESQKVFAELSANQLNWRPPNGTHTPRWNTEHMMATQLLFFSQIYAAIDPENHKVIRLNPKQMPKDYVAAHPDWDGKQEAALTAAVSKYLHDFAYLLEGLDLDQQPPGSRWKLRALLVQMDRHYGEHTANVVKKFELEGWPEE